MKLRLPKITVWRAIFAAILLSGLYATYLRVFHGLGGSTNLSDKFPWGLWIAFDVMCGVGLAAGGFTLVAIVHIFNIEKYKPVLRPAVLTAFLGYNLVVVGLLYDLGRPDRLWHPLVMWNPHSVMFEVAWCVTLYSTVLLLEFLPVVFEKFGWHEPLNWIHKISVPLMILGVLLSTLHQSSLGTLFLIVPEKLYPLWYTPLLPLLFYISAIAVGLAMTIFESWHSSRAFGRALELPLLASLGRVLAVVLSVYLWIRLLDLSHRHALGLLAQNRVETWLFGLEIALMLVPTILLYQSKVRMSPGALYACAVMVVFGFIANRLNVGTTGLEAGSGTHYVPKWSEIAVTLSIVAVGFATFRVIAQYFPIFEAQGHEQARDEMEETEEDAVAVG
jgi:Ni/Fe-hydrogenase subunit HybB-like protein